MKGHRERGALRPRGGHLGSNPAPFNPLTLSPAFAAYLAQRDEAGPVVASPPPPPGRVGPVPGAPAGGAPHEAR